MRYCISPSPTCQHRYSPLTGCARVSRPRTSPDRRLATFHVVSNSARMPRRPCSRESHSRARRFFLWSAATCRRFSPGRIPSPFSGEGLPAVACCLAKVGQGEGLPIRPAILSVHMAHLVHSRMWLSYSDIPVKSKNRFRILREGRPASSRLRGGAGDAPFGGPRSVVAAYIIGYIHPSAATFYSKSEVGAHRVSVSPRFPLHRLSC